MVDRGQDRVVSDEGPVPDPDSPGVLEGAAHVDEHAVAEVRVLAELREERREDVHRGGHVVSGQLSQESTNLVCGVFVAVEINRDPSRTLGGSHHEQMRLAPCLDGVAAGDECKRGVQVHAVIVARTGGLTSST